MDMPPVRFEPIACKGGLDQITPTQSLHPGVARSAINFEVATTGGYTRVAGYERLDGHPAPSAATYLILSVTGTTIPAIGSTITGATSGATGVLIAQTASTFVLTKVTGTFNGTEVLTSGGTVATQTGFGSASSQKVVAQYRSLAADVYRADIGKPAGSGAVLGAFCFNGIKYAFRNNALGTECVMFKSSSSGWTAIAFGHELAYRSQSLTPAEGATVTGVTSGATGVVARVSSRGGANGAGLAVTSITSALGVATVTTTAAHGLSSGAAVVVMGAAQTAYNVSTTATVTGASTFTYPVAGTPTTPATGTITYSTSSGLAHGALILLSKTGTFQADEALTVSGAYNMTATAASSAISLLPGGKFDFVETNFAGSARTTRVYGCDGVNRGWEFDGTTFVPISTGATTDTPKFVDSHKQHLVLAIGSSLIHSAPGLPYDYTALSGAAEIAVGDTIAGMLVQPGSQTTGAFAAFTKSGTQMLYGTGVSSWSLVPFAEGTGAIAWTCQNMAQSYALDDRGVFSIATSQNYGNFAQSALTAQIRPFIAAYRSLTTCSVVCREKSQYRVYFSNGMGLHMTIVNGKYLGAMPIYHPTGIHNAWAGSESNGDEIILLCGSDGYVYQAEKGTSFDGEPISASITLHHDSVKSPRILKRYRKCAVEMQGSSYAEVGFNYNLGYGKPEYPQPNNVTYSSNMLAGYWDSDYWDTFFWDASNLVPMECEMDGTAENVALTFFSSSDYFDSFTINSAIVHYTFRRALR